MKYILINQTLGSNTLIYYIKSDLSIKQFRKYNKVQNLNYTCKYTTKQYVIDNNIEHYTDVTKENTPKSYSFIKSL